MYKYNLKVNCLFIFHKMDTSCVQHLDQEQNIPLFQKRKMLEIKGHFYKRNLHTVTE